MLMRIIVCFFYFVIICPVLHAQIVNVESRRMQIDTIGNFGNFETHFFLERNANKIININVTAYFEHQTAKSIYILLANYNLLKANNRSFLNNTFYHLRYNYKINKRMYWEAFTQLQHNDITGIKLRRIVGTGPRFTLISNKTFALHAATAVMYEYEQELTQPIIYHYDFRSSSYASLSYKPSPNMEFSGTVFYQPLFNHFHNYRVLNEITANIKIVKHLSFKVIWYYLHDSNPAANTPKFNYSISNGIGYTF